MKKPKHPQAAPAELSKEDAIELLCSGNMTPDFAAALLNKRVRPIDYGEIPPRYRTADVLLAGRPYNLTPLVGKADKEYATRIDAERVTAEFNTRSAKHLDSGKRPITEAPLFGGPAQEELF